MTAKILETRKTTLQDGTVLITIAVLVQRRKIWLDSDLENVTLTETSADFDEKLFVVVKKQNERGEYLKLMPRFSLELSTI